jgi:hypothetical protein
MMAIASVVLLLASLLAGCAVRANRGAAGNPARGRVTGRLVLEGGPLGPGGSQPTARPIPGSVQFTSALRRISVRVGRSGTFVVSLPPGRYAVEGRSPYVTQGSGNEAGRGTETRCSIPTSVRVIAYRIARIMVTCIVP